MDKQIKEKYKLSQEEHERISKQIKQELFNNVSKQENPISIIVGGQPGSGKGAVISYSKNQCEQKGRSSIIITTDEYKPYHPDSIEVAKKYPTEYVEIIEQDAGLWTGEMLKHAIDNKYNFIFEGTLKNDRILERIKELKQNGFYVIVRALAVPRMESLIAIHERYENQIENMGWGRLISIEHHNTAYDNIPQVIDTIEKSGLCTVEIFKRGKKINQPQRVYSSKIDKKIYPTARVALEEYRELETFKTQLTAKSRIEKLKEAFLKRNATNKEMQQLDELEDYMHMICIDNSNEITK